MFFSDSCISKVVAVNGEILSLLSLSLYSNNLSNWDEICALLPSLPNMRSLSLRDNSFYNISTCMEFNSTKTLASSLVDLDLSQNEVIFLEVYSFILKYFFVESFFFVKPD